METVHHEVALANTEAELAHLHANRDANFISIESYLAWLPNEDILRLFREIGRLPNLHSFRISFSFQRFRQLPVLPIPSHALAELLQSAQKLEALTLDECRLVFRDGNDIQALSLALQRAPKLTHITLYNCFPQPPQPSEPPQDFPPDQLAQGISQIPTLEEFNVIFTLGGPESWISSLVGQSCTSNSMRALRINVPDGSCLGVPIFSMCRNLETNITLKDLSIRCCLDDEAGTALGQALKSPHNALEELYVQMRSYHHAIPIAQALAKNNHLKSFELRVWTRGDRQPLLSAYEAMLPHNLTLERLVIDNGRHQFTPLIDFYLALNRAGRRQLLEQGEHLQRQTWIDFLIRRAHPDVSFLYYTLSLNPCLIYENSQDDAPPAVNMNIDEPRRKRQKLGD